MFVCQQCSLHIHAAYSTSMRLNVPMLPLSEPNAVGLIIAHGKHTHTHTHTPTTSIDYTAARQFYRK